MFIMKTVCFINMLVGNPHLQIDLKKEVASCLNTKFFISLEIAKQYHKKITRYFRTLGEENR